MNHLRSNGLLFNHWFSGNPGTALEDVLDQRILTRMRETSMEALA